MNVKNYAGSEILLYLQVTKLAFHHWMDTGCKYNILSSETKDSVLVKAIAVTKVTSMCQLLEPNSLQAMQQVLGDIFTLIGLHYKKKKTHQFSETTNFYKEATSKTV